MFVFLKYKAGEIFELRLMMNFSGENRGYFFVCYTCPEEARRAIKELNNYEIRPGKPLGVIMSVDNRKLWISGIPKNRTPVEIKTDVEKLTDGVKDIILYPSLIDKSKTRGYAFVEYESHRAAALARRKLVTGRIFICGQEVEKIDWAEPENDVDDETMSKVKILFIRNLMATTSEDKIMAVFSKLSDGNVERVKKSKDYAFVHFASRESAEKALLNIKSENRTLLLDGADVEVTWSRPVDKYSYNLRKELINYFTGKNSQYGPYGRVERVTNRSSAACPPDRWCQRSSSGIKGLGAPGTTPPKNFVYAMRNNSIMDGYYVRPLRPEVKSGHMTKEQLEYYYQQLFTSHSPYAYPLDPHQLRIGGTSIHYPPELSNDTVLFPYDNTPPSEAVFPHNTNVLSTQSDGSPVTNYGSKNIDSNSDLGSNLYQQLTPTMPYSVLPGGYIWPNMYQYNPLLTAGYDAQCFSTMYSRNYQYLTSTYPQGTSQHQVIPATPQKTQFQPQSRISNSRRNSKNRNQQKHAKSR